MRLANVAHFFTHPPIEFLKKFQGIIQEKHIWKNYIEWYEEDLYWFNREIKKEIKRLIQFEKYWEKYERDFTNWFRKKSRARVIRFIWFYWLVYVVFNTTYIKHKKRRSFSSSSFFWLFCYLEKFINFIFYNFFYSSNFIITSIYKFS